MYGNIELGTPKMAEHFHECICHCAPERAVQYLSHIRTFVLLVEFPSLNYIAEAVNLERLVVYSCGTLTSSSQLPVKNIKYLYQLEPRLIFNSKLFQEKLLIFTNLTHMATHAYLNWHEYLLFMALPKLTHLVLPIGGNKRTPLEGPIAESLMQYHNHPTLEYVGLIPLSFHHWPTDIHPDYSVVSVLQRLQPKGQSKLHWVVLEDYNKDDREDYVPGEDIWELVEKRAQIPPVLVEEPVPEETAMFLDALFDS